MEVEDEECVGESTDHADVAVLFKSGEVIFQDLNPQLTVEHNGALAIPYFPRLSVEQG